MPFYEGFGVFMTPFGTILGHCWVTQTYMAQNMHSWVPNAHFEVFVFLPTRNLAPKNMWENGLEILRVGTE